MTDEEILEGLKAYTSKPEVIDKAIKGLKSLEAWELAKAEILKAQTYVMFVGDKDLYVERKDVLKIIDEHLKEVEEWD